MSKLETELETDENADMNIIKRMQELYFKPKKIERWKNGRLYEWIGIRKVEKFCVWLGHQVGKDNTWENNYFISDGSVDGLRAFERQTRLNETPHALMTAFCILATIGMYATGETNYGTFSAAMAMVSAAPVALQRYNRARIESILDKKSR